MDNSRYYKNTYGEYSPATAKNFLDGNKLKSDLVAKVSFLDDMLCRRLEEETSRLPKKAEHIVYTGYSGIAYLYLMKYKKTRVDSYLLKAKDINDDAVSQLKGRDISFLLGDAGPLALAAVIANKLGLVADTQRFIQKLVDLPRKVRDPPYEILYGYAGYLYALLFVNRELGSVISNDTIQKIVRIIIDDGKRNARASNFPAPLFYEWYDTNYLGAAHGVSGILYMLLCADKYLSKTDKEEFIKPTIDWLAQERFPSGNFKSNAGRDRDALVHWCHGSPGVVYLYLLARKVFNYEGYLHLALNCGDVVWSRGLLKKGYSICHGVSGNAYTFIHLYKETNDISHLYRAACFADWCTRYPEAEGHEPESPLSLFEGIAGLSYFLTDIQDPSEASFPAYYIN